MIEWIQRGRGCRGARCGWASLRRAFWVLLSGLALAAGVNALSPRGLDLGRDYFALIERPSSPRAAAAVSGEVEEGDLLALAKARLERQGLSWVDRAQVGELFRDARRGSGQVLFVDARSEELYQEGHVPGAYVFDPYRPEAQLATVLPLCQAAEQVVVYCHGADCEDSELAAVFLANAGVPKARLLVYAGGYAEWLADGQPVEIGPRGGGGGEAADVR